MGAFVPTLLPNLSFSLFPILPLRLIVVRWRVEAGAGDDVADRCLRFPAVQLVGTLHDVTTHTVGIAMNGRRDGNDNHRVEVVVQFFGTDNDTRADLLHLSSVLVQCSFSARSMLLQCSFSVCSIISDSPPR